MPDDLEIRIGATKRIAHTVRCEVEPESVTGTVYNSAGAPVASAAGRSVPGDADGIYEVSFLLSSAGVDPGDYTYALSYTADSETVLVLGSVALLPLVSQFDRWRRRVVSWMLETSNGEEQSLSFRQFRDAVEAAVTEYSKLISYRQATDVALTAGTWEYSLPDGWETGACRLLALEYPVDDDEQVRDWLDPDDWQVDEPRGLWRFTGESPQAGETARLYWQGPHQVRDATTALAAADTVPDLDFHSVAQYAAGLCLMELANRAARSNAPEVGASIVNARTKEQEYGARARAMIEAASDAWEASAKLGGGGELPPDASSATATWEYLPGHGI